MTWLIDTRTAAEMLGVKPDYVREHAADLGGMRLPGGPRAPLRFDAAVIRQVVEARRVTNQPPPAPEPRRRPGPRRGRRSHFELLPLPPGART